MHLPWLTADDPLPPTSLALGPDSDAPGLLAVGGGPLTTARLREAYSRGIFPWFSAGEPPLWWTTDPRMVLKTAAFKLAPSLRKTLKRFVRTPGCEVRVDHDFGAVMRACAAAPRAGQSGTWIVDEMVEAYGRWHAEGATHSVETWVDGALVGGLYVVALGGMLYGESMFSRRTDASKIALAYLVALARAHGVAWIDCQQQTRHLASFGAAPLPREAFEAHVVHAVRRTVDWRWTYDPAHWALLDPSIAEAAAAAGPAGRETAASPSPAPTDA